ncbi:hypothetical protein SISNIDRAFT_471844 [Sistotremastrum niveocremeum HHB9708]|uniref:DUF6532 domain-containing protein n=1 Tax=Sistotremastrum niveocremeum HHB9708 TaxID=1314777 RepID=A0A164M569_9AGAM|nr:hypothetical protein SISNIDRAFT_471844 [Sistotremastrum niveocremeum HHB9708]
MAPSKRREPQANPPPASAAAAAAQFQENPAAAAQILQNLLTHLGQGRHRTRSATRAAATRSSGSQVSASQTASSRRSGGQQATTNRPLSIRDMGTLQPRAGERGEDDEDEGQNSSTSKRNHDSMYEDEEDEELEEEEDDDDGPSSPTRRKTVGASHSTIIGQSRPVLTPSVASSSRNSRLRRERVLGTPAGASQSDSQSNTPQSRYRTPSPDGSDSRNTPFTPFKPEKFNKSRPVAGHLTPTSRDWATRTNSLFAVKLVTKGAFNILSERNGMAEECLMESLMQLRQNDSSQDSKWVRRELRFNEDIEYKQGMISLIRKRDSNIRGKPREQAAPLVPVIYRFDRYTTPEALKAHVASLRHKAAFTFLDPAEPVLSRSNAFRNPIISQVLAATYFSGAQSEAVRFQELFKPLSLELLAFVCCAIECAIASYASGTFVPPTVNEFTDFTYRNVYLGHLFSLESFKSNDPTGLAELQEDLWNSSWKMTGLDAPVGNVPVAGFLDFGQMVQLSFVLYRVKVVDNSRVCWD